MTTIKVDVNRVLDVGEVPAVKLSSIVSLRPEGLELLRAVEEESKHEIAAQGDCDSLNIGIGRLKKILKYIEVIRKEATKPLRDATTAVNDKCNPVTERFQKVINAGAKTVRVWDDEQDRIAAEQEAKAKAEQKRRENISIAKGGDGKVAAVTAPMSPVVSRSTSYRTSYVPYVTDQAKVPEGYKMVNMTAVRDAIRRSDRDDNNKPVVQIPGIEIREEKVRVG